MRRSCSRIALIALGVAVTLAACSGGDGASTTLPPTEASVVRGAGAEGSSGDVDKADVEEAPSTETFSTG